MLTTVAVDRAADPLALLDEPLWRLLYAFHHHEEREHRRALQERLLRVDAARMNAYAFNHPPGLDDERQGALDAIAEYERGPVNETEDLATLRALGEALAARIERGRVLSPDAVMETAR